MLRVVDTYCKAGGISVGWARAAKKLGVSLHIVGVDIDPQPRYPFEFIRGDAIEFLQNRGSEFDILLGSPPCMRYSRQTAMHGQTVVDSHPDLIDATRSAMIKLGLSYVIENVEGAPLIDPLLLCGSMFGSERLRRHRLFESNMKLEAPGPCRHDIQHDVISVTGHSGGTSTRDGASRFGGKAVWQSVMGIDWMTNREMSQAIPPMYSEWIASQVLKELL